MTLIKNYIARVFLKCKLGFTVIKIIITGSDQKAAGTYLAPGKSDCGFDCKLKFWPIMY
jgi:hypothetical protein